MKVYVIVILTLIKLGASEVDEELQEKFTTMSRSNFVDHFNEKNYSWKIKQYTNLTLNMRVGVQNRDINGLPVKTIDPRTVIGPLPESFDARTKWPHCNTIRKIRNQLRCSSCWAHGVADVASDRMCIHTGRLIELSVQDLECSNPHQTICLATPPSIGFKFWKDYGLVSEKCKPYEPFNLYKRKCEKFCKNNPNAMDYFQDKFRAAEVYAIPKDSWQIKAELFFNGPIQALMRIYDDFMLGNGEQGYSSGIYEHTHGEFKILHSVRVIGYGVENGVEYWLVANSWGPEWGEEGYFRIKSFQPYIAFEESMITGLPFV